MAVLENPPSYVPESNGLNCPYTLDFNVDLTHILPLRGMWQGTPVQAKTLYVNNYSNNFTLTIKAGTNQSLVPALSQGYVNIEKFDEIIIVSESGALVTIGVLDYPVPSGFTSRGNAPNSLTSDPYFSSVLLLTHFENSNGSNIAVNSKNGGVVNLNSGAAISTLQYKFGSSSANITAAASQRVTTTVTTPNPIPETNYTHECFVNFSAMADGNYSTLAISSVAGGGIAQSIGIQVVSGSITNIFIGTYSGSLTKFGNVSKPLNYNQWYHFAITNFGGTTKIFVDGQLVTSSNGVTTIGNADTINIGTQFGTYPTALGYYDDERYTNNVCRYLTNFTPPTSAFLDQ